MKKYIPLLFVVLVFMSACKTSSVYTDVLVPADINIPQHIQRIGILNRSLPAKGQGWQNILEGFITGESIAADRQGSYNVCKGLSFKVNSNPRFKAVIIDGEGLRGTGTKEFPTPLYWAKVDELCKKYNVNAIVCLETFDSDIRLRTKSHEVEKTISGEKQIVTEYLADLNIQVNAGWRIYDNKEKSIIDENVFYDDKSWEGKGPTSEHAISNLPSKRDAIDDAGYFAGEMMGVRISPNWVRVSRYYYTKGDDRFSRAKAFIKVNNWKNAVEIWKEVVNSPDPKAAGRACHNMAVASEMEGKLDIALHWAQKAYSQFGIKRERHYIAQLSIRKTEIERLKQQLPGKR